MEEWKPVPGFEGIYEASNLEMVKRIKAACGTRVGRMLVPANGGRGYMFVSLSKNDVTYRTNLGRLVAKVFIPNPQNLPEVNHKDGDKSHNASRNLEWCTHSDNMAHAFATGLYPGPENCGGTKLTWEQVNEIRSRYVRGNGKTLSKEFGVTNTQICRIVKGRGWTHEIPNTKRVGVAR